MMKEILEQHITQVVDQVGFSGAVHIQSNGEPILECAFGYSNRSEQLKNTPDTRFGIASGCKLFTAVGIGMLVDEGKLTFQTKLNDCLEISFPNFSEEITIHHLLTHSSGIPDYFDESVMGDFEELWEELPMYRIQNLHDFLPMFQNREMLFQPGEKFHYNNAGYIVLGLIIENITGMNFTDFIETKVFAKVGMEGSGYFSLDQLPTNTAFGYLDDEQTGSWRTNMYSIPIKGGADGGAFVTVKDMTNFWNALFGNQIVTKETLELLRTPHMQSSPGKYYGYGVWIDKPEETISKYHVMGYDPGVSFHGAVYPNGTTIVIASNKSDGAYSIIKAMEEVILA
ncbi:serine hydrolase domain-containing protein [Ornithinibacillus xuwenensis]